MPFFLVSGKMGGMYLAISRTYLNVLINVKKKKRETKKTLTRSPLYGYVSISFEYIICCSVFIVENVSTFG